jgi:hypothetical protein
VSLSASTRAWKAHGCCLEFSFAASTQRASAALLPTCCLQTQFCCVCVPPHIHTHHTLRFELQEVRYDVQKYPYLLLGSLKDWQECTGNPSQEAAGFPCLADTAKFPDVAALTAKHVLSVIVGGSQTPTFCNGTKEDVCNSLYMGYTGSIGPWYVCVCSPSVCITQFTVLLRSRPG